jgi:hypothetical protein
MFYPYHQTELHPRHNEEYLPSYLWQQCASITHHTGRFQGYWGQRERFIYLLEWLAALGNAVGMDEWITDSEAARILAGRLRNDHA